MKIRSKKSLGQNFLTDVNILEKIIKLDIFKDSSEIIEIGPGTGNLTKFLVKLNPKNIFVIEKDENLVKNLSLKFGNKINIINK